MQDCKLIVTVRNDKEGLKRGLDMDDVKNNMLDIHLAAMETLEEQLRGGTPDTDGS